MAPGGPGASRRPPRGVPEQLYSHTNKISDDMHEGNISDDMHEGNISGDILEGNISDDMHERNVTIFDLTQPMLRSSI